MIFFEYFDSGNNKKTILLNEKFIGYCLENEENKKNSDIVMMNGKRITVPNTLVEVVSAIIQLEIGKSELH